MCGLFTAMTSWREAVTFANFLTAEGPPKPPPGAEEDRQVTYRVMGTLPVIIFDKEQGKRRVVPMRWGFPHPKDWRRPQPIHARSETIETTKAFAQAFADGQRGIVLMKTFNEAPDIEGPTIQHTITPGDEPAVSAAFVWRKFDIPGVPMRLYACVLVTVPANQLISTLPTDRMPAFLAAENWGKWLGEQPASTEELKGCLLTVEGVRWTMTKQEKAAKPRKSKPTVSDPGGLF